MFVAVDLISLLFTFFRHGQVGADAAVAAATESLAAASLADGQVPELSSTSTPASSGGGEEAPQLSLSTLASNPQPARTPSKFSQSVVDTALLDACVRGELNYVVPLITQYGANPRFCTKVENRKISSVDSIFHFSASH